MRNRDTFPDPPGHSGSSDDANSESSMGMPAETLEWCCGTARSMSGGKIPEDDLGDIVGNLMASLVLWGRSPKGPENLELTPHLKGYARRTIRNQIANYHNRDGFWTGCDRHLGDFVSDVSKGDSPLTYYDVTPDSGYDLVGRGIYIRDLLRQEYGLLCSLTPDESQALELHLDDGLRYREIAEIQGCSTAAAYARVQSAKDKLAEEYGLHRTKPRGRRTHKKRGPRRRSMSSDDDDGPPPTFGWNRESPPPDSRFLFFQFYVINRLSQHPHESRCSVQPQTPPAG